MCRPALAAVYNGFWNPDGPPPVVRRLMEAAGTRGVELKPLPNTALIADIGSAPRLIGMEADAALFWDKDARLARTMEAAGVRVYNTAAAVAVCDDKAATHLALAGRDIPMPRTLVAPMTYVSVDETPVAFFLEQAARALGFPLVVKECYGSLGGQVYLARDAAGLAALAAGMGAKPFLCQQYVQSAHGTDKRLYVVDGRVAAAMRRRGAAGDFRSNVGSGGNGEAYAPTETEAALAVRCCALLGLRFGGVDLLDGPEGPLVCEVNASAWMTALEACTGADVAGAIIDCVIKYEKEAAV